jgi:hypothetical protein
LEHLAGRAARAHPSRPETPPQTAERWAVGLGRRRSRCSPRAIFAYSERCFAGFRGIHRRRDAGVDHVPCPRGQSRPLSILGLLGSAPVQSAPKLCYQALRKPVHPSYDDRHRLCHGRR